MRIYTRPFLGQMSLPRCIYGHPQIHQKKVNEENLNLRIYLRVGRALFFPKSSACISADNVPLQSKSPATSSQHPRLLWALLSASPAAGCSLFDFWSPFRKHKFDFEFWPPAELKRMIPSLLKSRRPLGRFRSCFCLKLLSLSWRSHKSRSLWILALARKKI